MVSKGEKGEKLYTDDSSLPGAFKYEEYITRLFSVNGFAAG